MPYPMSRLCLRVGGKEFNFHSFIPCRRVLDMVEGLGTLSKSRGLMHICGKGMHLPACAPANSHWPELARANGMRTRDIPVCGILRKVGRPVDWLAGNCLIQYLTRELCEPCCVAMRERLQAQGRLPCLLLTSMMIWAAIIVLPPLCLWPYITTLLA
jgi:hypothetical protein